MVFIALWVLASLLGWILLSAAAFVIWMVRVWPLTLLVIIILLAAHG